MENKDHTVNELEQYSQDVAQKVFDKLPKSVVELLGLTVEDVRDDLESKLTSDGLVAKYKSLEWTTDYCWECDLSVEQCVENIFGDYERILLG